MIDRQLMLKQLREVSASATPAPWTGTVNYPFYAHLDKPAPSLSKHEGTARGRNCWRVQDVEFVLAARYYMTDLLDYVAELENTVAIYEARDGVDRA